MQPQERQQHIMRLENAALWHLERAEQAELEANDRDRQHHEQVAKQLYREIAALKRAASVHCVECE